MSLDQAIDTSALETARAILAAEQTATDHTHLLGLVGRLVANYDRLSVRLATLAATRAEEMGCGALVRSAVNTACDQIVEAITPSPDQADLLNLLVNVSIYQAEHPGTTLAEAVEAQYQLDVNEVLGWVR